MELSTSPVPAVREVKIHYSLPKAAQVRLSIYDIRGKLVRSLVDFVEQAGSRTVLWDCRDSKGEKVPSGTYFVRLETVGFSACRKLAVLQ